MFEFFENLWRRIQGKKPRYASMSELSPAERARARAFMYGANPHVPPEAFQQLIGDLDKDSDEQEKGESDKKDNIE